MSHVMPYVAAAIVVLLVGSLVYIDHLQSKVDRLGDELTTAIAEREAADRAIAELAVERAIADRRAGIVSDSREAIRSADDGEVAPVLWTGLRAADEIGGIE